MRLASTLAAIVMATTMAACGCGTKPATTPDDHTGSGGGGGGGNVAECEAQRPTLDRLYRADATVHEPTRIDQAVADNIAMVLGECARAPTRVSTCVAQAADAAQLEKDCLTVPDDEGTEGDSFLQR